ncbi:MAG: hypothetical protein HY289_03645 [Planctomycetes bacterium]|nr:hypothetical protein [Planctomycetota bacterium]
MARFSAMILGSMLGALGGGAFGVLLGYLLAPEVDPTRPIAHEWYTLTVFAYVFWSACGGAILGMVVGSLPTVHLMSGAAAGLAVGLIAGTVAWDRGMMFGAAHHSYTGFTIVWITFGIGTIGAISGGVWSVARRSPTDADARQTPNFSTVSFVVVGILAVLIWALGFAWFFRLWDVD